MIKLLASQYVLQQMDWDAYKTKITNLVRNASHVQAKLLLLPEYAGLEIGIPCDNDKTLFAAIQSQLPNYLELFQQLAKQYNLYIQAGTVPVATDNQQYVNRAYFFGPDGNHGYQDKLQLTRYEKTSGLIVRGNEQVLFETSLGMIGIAVCYDCEFPEIVRPLVTQGAALILVPTYTTTLAGYYRVSLSARARAIENQCFVATSSIVGAVTLGTDAEEITTGQSAIFSPADEGFPASGVIAQGEMNSESVVTGEIDLEKLAALRENSEVNNFADYQQYYRQFYQTPRGQQLKIIAL